jgi:hypothetical protein
MSYTHFKGVSVTEDGLAFGTKGNEVALFASVLEGSATWDPASILDGDMESVNVTVTGAVLGDFVLVSLGTDTLDLSLTAQVTASNTVTATLANNTGGAVDLTSSTLRVKVLKR